ncbi:MAG: CBS domain-containing protein [archaeon]
MNKKIKFSLYKAMIGLSPKITVKEVMTRDIKKLKINDTVFSCLELMAKHSISGIIVVNEKEIPVGIVSEGDIIRKVFLKNRDPKKVDLSEIMTPNLQTVISSLSIDSAALIMNRKKISKLPVIEDRKLVGFVTKTDILQKLHDIYSQNRMMLWLGLFNVVLLIAIVVVIMNCMF